MYDTLRLESIRLRVPDLAKSVDYYTRRLGFVAGRVAEHEAELGVAPDAPPLLTLTETRAPPGPHDAAGLFHAALLLPNRPALGNWLRFASAQGFSDHGVSEAIYCADADGNGLEFYVDRQRPDWPFTNGQLAMSTLPLDLEALLAESAPSPTAILGGARWGHLHLRVTNLDRSEKFYQRALGMEVTQNSYPGARFLAADGYHHHVGLNSWGAPRHPQPRGALGLALAIFARAGIPAAIQVADPDGMALQLRPLV